MLKSYIAWEGPDWRLRVEQMGLPGHGDDIIETGVIEHPGSVVLIPLTTENTVLVIHQYRLALKQTILELPAGTREKEEAWLSCAQRELREETGFRAETFTFLGEIWPAPGVSNELMKIYLAQHLTPDPLPADMDEEIEIRPLPLSDLLAMVENGRIRDAKTIVGLLKTVAYIQNNP